MSKIQVIHPERIESETKSGLNSRPIFQSETDLVSEVRISGSTAGGWHHHGKRTMYGYVLTGKLSIEYDQDRAVLSPGDFFLIPPGLVHRDVNPNEDEARILIFSIGEGPASFEASKPNSLTQ